MTGWNLPDGCTNADIDRAMGGDSPRCSNEHCGLEVDSWDDMIECADRGDRETFMCKECAGVVEDDEMPAG